MCLSLQCRAEGRRYMLLPSERQSPDWRFAKDANREIAVPRRRIQVFHQSPVGVLRRAPSRARARHQSQLFPHGASMNSWEIWLKGIVPAGIAAGANGLITGFAAHGIGAE